MQAHDALVNTVRRQKAKYCRLVDTKRWDDFAALIVDRPELRFYGPDGALLYAFDSLPEYMKVTKKFLEGAHTIHQIHNDEIDVLSETEVHGIWSMEDYLKLAPGDNRPRSMHGYGHYHETWRFEAGNWRLFKLDLRRTILEVVPAD